MLPRLQVDPAKVTQVYALLTTFLLVVEGLQGFWFYRAESSMERIIAGVFMLVVLGAFLVVVLMVQPRQAEGGLKPRGLADEIKPAATEATKEQVTNPPAELIAGPNGQYLIARPPEHWSSKVLPLSGVAPYMMDMAPPVPPGPSEPKDCFVLRSNWRNLVRPIPGVSEVDGRIIPTALPVPARVELAIIPAARFSPPLYVERTFEHNVLIQAFSLQNQLTSLYRVSRGKTSDGHRDIWTWEFKQDLAKVEVDGAAGTKAELNVILIGIEGDVHDHFLVLKYPSFGARKLPDLDAAVRELQKLASSFQPLRVADKEAKMRELRTEADVQFDRWMKDNGQTAFMTEFALFMSNARTWNLEDSEQRQRLIRELEGFQMLATLTEVQDPDLGKLWQALKTAREGDERPLKKAFSQAVIAYDEQMAA